MTAKDRLAASLLNHWYCIDRALKLNRLSKVPKLKEKYDDLKALDKNDEKAMDKLADKFTLYNHSSFQSNIVHITQKDEVLKDFGGKATVTSNRFGIAVVVELTEEASTQMGSILSSLRGPDQHAGFTDVMEKLPGYNAGMPGSFLYSTGVNRSFLGSMSQADRSFIVAWNAIKTVLGARKFILEAVKEDEKKSLLSGKVHINLHNPRVEDDVFKADGFSMVETPQAKEARLIKERLAEALRRRTKSVREVGIAEESVDYVFDEENLDPFKVNLEVVTDW